jgi:hypothetical protein
MVTTVFAFVFVLLIDTNVKWGPEKDKLTKGSLVVSDMQSSVSGLLEKE